MKFTKISLTALTFLSVQIAIVSGASAGSETIYFYDGVPIVDCSIDLQKAARSCVIDTGSNGSKLPPELFDNFKSASATTGFLTASGLQNTCTDISAKTFLLGTLPLSSDHISKCVGSVHGVIGIDAIDGKSWRFDFKKKRITADKEFDFGGRGQTFKRDNYGFAYVRVSIDSISVFALFDTGVTSDGAVDPAFVKAHPNLFRFKGTVSAQDPSGAYSSYRTYEVNTVSLGAGLNSALITIAAIEQPEMWEVFEQSGAPFILGMGVIGKYDWHIDLRENLWIAE